MYRAIAQQKGLSTQRGEPFVAVVAYSKRCSNHQNIVHFLVDGAVQRWMFTADSNESKGQNNAQHVTTVRPGSTYCICMIHLYPLPGLGVAVPLGGEI